MAGVPVIPKWFAVGSGGWQLCVSLHFERVSPRHSKGKRIHWAQAYIKIDFQLMNAALHWTVRIG